MGSDEATRAPLAQPCRGSAVGFSDHANISYKNMYHVQYYTSMPIAYIIYKYIIMMKIRHLLLKVYLNYIILTANGFGLQSYNSMIEI